MASEDSDSDWSIGELDGTTVVLSRDSAASAVIRGTLKSHKL